MGWCDVSVPLLCEATCKNSESIQIRMTTKWAFINQSRFLIMNLIGFMHALLLIKQDNLNQFFVT